MCQLLKRIDNGGYTLLESLLHLIIFAVFAQLILLFFLWKSPIEQIYTNKSTTAWELFAMDLQENLSDIRQFEIHDGSRGIRVRNQKDVAIDIEQRNGVIRKRTSQEGHVPLLTDIYSAIFSFDGATLLVEVTMADGTRKERDFAIGLNSE